MICKVDHFKTKQRFSYLDFYERVELTRGRVDYMDGVTRAKLTICRPRIPMLHHTFLCHGPCGA